jgi:hypothetical protein
LKQMAAYRNMRTKKERISKTKGRVAPRKRRPRKADLLIIECNSAKLASEGLNLGTLFAQLANHDIAQALLPGKQIVLIRTSTEDRLKQDLAAVHEKHGRFRSIFVVGHSDEFGLQLTQRETLPSGEMKTGRYSWRAVGNWLEKFEPEFIFLAACHAGRSSAVRELFRAIPKTLKQVYGSPTLLHKIHVPPLAVLIAMLLVKGKIDEDQSGGLRLAHYPLTGAQIFRWKRAELGSGQEVKAAAWDSVSSLLYKGAWDLLEHLFPTNRGAASGV